MPKTQAITSDLTHKIPVSRLICDVEHIKQIAGHSLFEKITLQLVVSNSRVRENQPLQFFKLVVEIGSSPGLDLVIRPVEPVFNYARAFDDQDGKPDGNPSKVL
jgi:hypothetical protein